jgi:CBS domain containing-hemolysin-like protein
LTIYSIALIPVLILINAFFVAVEMAVARVRHTRIDQLASEENKTAILVKRALKDPRRYISACQLGITIATLGLGATGEAVFADNLADWVGGIFKESALGLPAISSARALCYIFAFTVTAFVQTIFGELVPKICTFQYAETVIMATIYPMEAWCFITSPFIKLLGSFTDVILRAFKFDVEQPHNFVHSEEELRMLVTASQEEGVLESEEEEMIHSVFEFADTTAGEIMTPRSDMVTLKADTSVKELVEAALKNGFSRIPIYEDSKDNIFGFVHLRDGAQAMLDHKDAVPIREFARNVLIVPENKNLADLLPEFQKSKTHVAIVVNEHGTTVGIVTLEDLVEELVGDIADEYDVVREMIKMEPDGSFLVDAKLGLEEVNEKLGLKIENEEFNTLGGHVFGLLGREPKPGDEITEDGYILRIVESDRHRIIKLRLIRLTKPEMVEEPVTNGRTNGKKTKDSASTSETAGQH